MTEPRCVHLLDAHSAELLAKCHRARLYLSLCGEELATEDLPSPECERDVTYCLACISHCHQTKLRGRGARRLSTRGDGVGPVSGVHLFAGDQLAEGHRYPGGFRGGVRDGAAALRRPARDRHRPGILPGVRGRGRPLERRGWRGRIESCRPRGRTMTRLSPDAGFGAALRHRRWPIPASRLRRTRTASRGVTSSAGAGIGARSGPAGTSVRASATSAPPDPRPAAG